MATLMLLDLSLRSSAELESSDEEDELLLESSLESSALRFFDRFCFSLALSFLFFLGDSSSLSDLDCLAVLTRVKVLSRSRSHSLSQ